jgi:GNAT superfamily N-acetyltransferase
VSAPLRVVAAGREHYAEFVRLFPELGVHDPIPSLEVWWKEMAPGSLFLELDGRAVGYGFAQALSRTGYVRHVIVDPDYRGRGLGRSTMLALADWLRKRGCERWELNVRSDNGPALSLYRSLGMEHAFLTWAIQLPRERVEALPRSATPIRIAPIAPERDEAIEKRFELAPGLLASLRQRAGQRLLLAGSDDEPVGAARFDPNYPGCFPFCARGAQVARAMLEAMVPEISADKPWIQVTVERDEPLVRALRAAGGALRLEIAHLEGPLPAV